MRVKTLVHFIILLSSFSIFSQPLVVVTENWAPYNFEKDGVLQGTSTKLIKMVLDRAKIDYKINVWPWARTYKTALNQKNVLIYTIIRTHNRENLFQWLGPLGRPDGANLYKLKKRKDIKIRFLEDAKKYMTATNYESLWHQYLKLKGFDRKSISVVPKLPQVVKLFMNGRVDLMTDNDTTVADHLKKEGFSVSDIEPAYELFKSYPYFAMNKSSDPTLVEKIKKAYQELVKEGKIPAYLE